MEINIVRKCSDYYKYLMDNCTICNEKKGAIIDGKMFKDCECTVKYLSDLKYIKAGMMPIYIGIFDEIKETMSDKFKPKFDILMDNLQNIQNNTNLLLCKDKKSTVGCSSVTMLIAKHLIDIGKNVRIIKMSELVETFFKNGEHNFETVDILIIDNFGYEYHKTGTNEDFIPKKFLALLQLRNIGKRFTIISSSKTLKQIGVEYNANINDYLTCNYFNFMVDIQRKYKSANEQMQTLIPELSALEPVKPVKKKIVIKDDIDHFKDLED